MKERLSEMTELPKWWDEGLNLITGLRPEDHETGSEAEKRYYRPNSGYSTQIEE